MGAGKSTIMRSLPKPWGNFVKPDNVPDMLLDYACEINGDMFYEIDAPTATGKMWIDWLKIADLQVVVGNGLREPDSHFVELWDYLKEQCPNTNRIIILNRIQEVGDKWSDYNREKTFCIGMGEVINEETAIASENDILAVLNHIKGQ